MALGSHQLENDFEQLQNTLELYPKITVLSTEGQPPDHYEIEYALQGFVRGSDGNVEVSDTHRIRISLPFGYPHFAPTVKPLTNIFHPDVDPAAVRIADQWQKNPSLASLVVFIGEMICGKEYHLENPFNPKAAQWYTAHEASLPLDSLTIADIEESIQDIDSLVDDTFSSLGLEIDTFLEPEATYSEEDVQPIRDLVASKKLYTASNRLAEIPASVDMPDRETLQISIEQGIHKVEQLYRLIEQLEDNGKFDEALEVVENVYEIASDVPGGEELRQRLELACSLKQKKSPSAKQKATKKKKEAPKEQPPSPPPQARGKQSLPKLHFFIPLQLILGITVALALCAWGITLYFKDQNIVSRIQANISKAQLLIDNGQFDAARDSLEYAQETLADLTILRFRKSNLDNRITTLLKSKEMREGLVGNVLYQGEYMPAEAAQAQRKLAAMIEQAKALVDQNQRDSALTTYKQALDYAEKKEIRGKNIELQRIIKALELQIALSHAAKAEMGHNWKQAAETYSQALELSQDLSDPETASEIIHKLTTASFRLQWAKSKQSFTQSEWQKTVATLQQAQDIINQNPDIVSDRERQNLHRLWVNSSLYNMLNGAREAYQQKNWNETIRQYQKAIDLLDTESANFEGLLDDSMYKIQKTLLKVKIAQLQEKVLLAEYNNDIDEGIRQSQNIQQLIKSSPLSGDPEIKNIAQKIGEQINARQKEMELDRKLNYLKENYAEIFRTNYPTFKGSRLQSPKVTFLHKRGNKHIFSISCTERSQGSSSRLELNYAYDEATQTWSVYDE
ncbi:MAG: hypothetical protein CSA33_06795 [Desulfobulbus propionicus]|nr:MAG: hypothetical protein CSA33_06795 [Desulfobulbus propionicus]